MGMDRKIEKKKWPPRKIAARGRRGRLRLFVVLYLFLFQFNESTLTSTPSGSPISTVTKGPFLEFIPIQGTVMPVTRYSLETTEGGRSRSASWKPGPWSRSATRSRARQHQPPPQHHVAGGRLRPAEQRAPPDPPQHGAVPPVAPAADEPSRERAGQAEDDLRSLLESSTRTSSFPSSTSRDQGSTTNTRSATATSWSESQKKELEYREEQLKSLEDQLRRMDAKPPDVERRARRPHHPRPDRRAADPARRGDRRLQGPGPNIGRSTSSTPTASGPRSTSTTSPGSRPGGRATSTWPERPTGSRSAGSSRPCATTASRSTLDFVGEAPPTSAAARPSTSGSSSGTWPRPSCSPAGRLLGDGRQLGLQARRLGEGGRQASRSGSAATIPRSTKSSRGSSPATGSSPRPTRASATWTAWS